MENARKWHLLAQAIGYNELAKLGRTLGEKVYARLARDSAAAEYEAASGIANLFAREESVLEIEAPGPMPNIRFTSKDLDLMRAAVERATPPWTVRGRCAALLRSTGWVDSDPGFEERVEALYSVLEGRGDRRDTARTERRQDGALVPVDRWETGIRNIVGILLGERAEFEVPDVVERVRKLHAVAEAALALVADCRDQGRDDCMDDLVDEQLVERLRATLAALGSEWPARLGAWLPESVVECPECGTKRPDEPGWKYLVCPTCQNRWQPQERGSNTTHGGPYANAGSGFVEGTVAPRTGNHPAGQPALLLMEAHELLREHEVEETVGAVRALQAAFQYGASFPRRESTEVRPRDAWHEDVGAVLWWSFPVKEPPYAGTPLDDDFPEYMTHWAPIVVPEAP